MIHKILVPIDLSDYSERVFEVLRPLRDAFSPEIVLCHVIESRGVPLAQFSQVMDVERARSVAEDKLVALTAVHFSDTDKISSVVRTGVAADELVDLADDLSCDLIALTTRGHEGLAHAVLGSTTERVLRHANCPVLVTRLGN